MRHNKKILLGDDSRTSLFLAQMILKRGPYRIVTASDGAEGVEKAVTERPDLILMDVVMPRLNGFEALQRLRERDETRTTPVIFVTTRGEPINVETGLGEGATTTHKPGCRSSPASPSPSGWDRAAGSTPSSCI